MLIQAIDSDSGDPGPTDKPPKPDGITKRLRNRTPQPPMDILDNQPPEKKDVIRDGEELSTNPETSYTSS